MKGIALLPVVLLCVAIALVVLATYGDARVRERRHQRHVRQVETAGTVARAAAAMEASTRVAVFDGEAPSRVSLYYPQQATVTQRAPNGEWQRRRVTALSVSSAALPTAILAAAGADPTSTGEPHGPSAAREAAAWLARELEANTTEADLRDNDLLRARIERTLSVVPAVYAEWLDAHSERIVAALDSLARLRRTHSHPSRLRGIDRGRVPATAVLRVGPPTAASGDAVAGEAPAMTERRLPLAQRLQLRVQRDWLYGSPEQPGGVVRGAPFGPEVLDDSEWFATTTSVPIPERTRAASEATYRARLTQATLALGAGVLLVDARRRGVALLQDSSGWQAHPFAMPSLAGVCTQRHGARRWWGWRDQTVWTATGASLPQLDAQWAQLTLPGEVRAIVPVAGAVLVWAEDRQLVEIGCDGAIGRSDLVDAAIRGLYPLPLWNSALLATAAGWLRVDAGLALQRLSGTPLPRGAEAVADGTAGVWWLQPSDVAGGRALLAHGCLREERFEIGHATLPERATSLTALSARRLVAVWQGSAPSSVTRFDLWRSGGPAPVRVGGGVQPRPGLVAACPATMTLFAPDDDVVWVTKLEREILKNDQIDGHQLLAPLRWHREASFQAPLTTHLTGRLVSGAGVVSLSASGTVNHGASVLAAHDLSDLVCDGVLLDPRRGEGLRYSTLESAVEEPVIASSRGSGGILIKPVRAAADCPQPHRERVLLRTTQLGWLRVLPSPEWFAAMHIAQPDPSLIVTLSRQGPPERSFSVVSEIVRLPASAQWLHRRRVQVHGAPWVVVATLATDPPSQLSLAVDQHFPGRASSHVAVDDVCRSGEWIAVEWGWSDSATTLLRVGEAEVAATAGAAAGGFVAGGVFTTQDAGWILELGGGLGDSIFDGNGASQRSRVFHGTVQQIFLQQEPFGTAASRWSLTAIQPSARWVLPVEFPSGSQLLRIAALGDFSDGTGIDWELQACRMTGSTTVRSSTRVFSPLPGVASEATTYALQWTLRASPDGRRTPILEGVDVDYLPPPRGVHVAPLAVVPSAGVVANITGAGP
ncbi:MAG: hypothetical protein AAF581_00550 [Planctomycetota bacterium]